MPPHRVGQSWCDSSPGDEIEILEVDDKIASPSGSRAGAGAGRGTDPCPLAHLLGLPQGTRSTYYLR